MNDIFAPSETLNETYPHLTQYDQAIRQSFWTPEHFTYDRDVRDFKIKLTETQKEAIKRCMLAIGVVENKVKTFWARIDIRMPKTEIADVGHTFAGNEVIHKITYKRLLDDLGLDKEFEKIFNIECMDGRSKYLTKYLQGINSRSNKEFTKSLILFTLLVENCSLFTQFLIISSFNKYENILTNFSTIVTATAKEENLHGQFGAELIKIIRKENPEWFDEEMEQKIRRNVRKAYRAEVKVLDWIFEKGELDFMPKENVIEYLKLRFNYSLEQLGYEPEFDIDSSLIKPTKYFDRMTKSSVAFDFFNEKGTEYSETNKITDEAWDF